MTDDKLLEVTRFRMQSIDKELKSIPRNYKTMTRRFTLYKQWRELKRIDNMLSSEEQA